MNILVIGGAGYIGSILLRHLLSERHHVRLLDVFLYGKESVADIRDKIEIVEGDFRNTEVLRYCMRGIDTVVHLAAIVGDQACDLDQALTLDVNYSSAVDVAKIAKELGIKKLIFSSTCSVYGANDNILSETSELKPVSLYAKSKIWAEKEILAMCDDSFQVCIPRFGTIYGVSPRMRFDLAVNVMTARALAKGHIEIDGGDQWRPFLHVSDAALAIAHMIQNKITGVFNVGKDSENYQIDQVGTLIQKITRASVIRYQENRDKRNYRVSFQKITGTGWTTQKSVQDGIIEILDFLKKEKSEYSEPRFSNLVCLSGGAIKILQEFKKRGQKTCGK